MIQTLRFFSLTCLIDCPGDTTTAGRASTSNTTTKEGTDDSIQIHIMDKNDILANNTMGFSETLKT